MRWLAAARELHYQISLGDLRGDPFPQLFVDSDTLAERAGAGGWKTDVVWSGEEGRYLAELTPSVDAGPSGN